MPKHHSTSGPARLRMTCILVAVLGAGGCVDGNRLSREQAREPGFDAIAFFSGHTEGKGMLKVAMRRAVPALVEGDGRVEPDGSITLDQTVRRGERASTHRQWHLRANGPGHYVGTLSDAVGPVLGTVEGNRLHIAFAMKGGLKAEQWMYLEPGGEVARNVMVVGKFGMPVARLDETIIRMTG